MHHVDSRWLNLLAVVCRSLFLSLYFCLITAAVTVTEKGSAATAAASVGVLTEWTLHLVFARQGHVLVVSC